MEDYNEEEASVNYKSISCEQIPELFLDKLIAKNHFSKFGKIRRFILKPKRLSCTVEYESEDQAEKALSEGNNYNGHEFKVSYSLKEVAHVQNTEEWVDPDVQAELEAMGGNASKLPSFTSKSIVMPAPVLKKPFIKTVQSQPMAMSKPHSNVPKMEPEKTKVDPSLRQELITLLKKPAFNDEDKYRVLDARDKLIRLLTVRQTDIKKAKATKGTCPDMCPEKERVMRAFQRQVSGFEQPEENDVNNESAISHKKAVKEYSRSSADQEAPLAHELRSEKVLQMTMLYLMHQIADLCDQPRISISDWFHFLWDRTRSIRKDITQQELCSLGAVELVEQCARFHIHCAARLIAEDPSVFDKKINAENLTKCFQTLKYMYHDLRIKGVSCPREAEFRSYMVLLNLGDANFLFELKYLPEHIQNSEDIRHALSFYNALQNNNYVRFFNLVRSAKTSYMSACILMRYFYKLRIRAMSAIIKAHRGKNVPSIPLQYLTNILAFEDEESALDFLQYHGLNYDEEKGVSLDRMVKPEIEYCMDRAINLVEAKRKVSVGECICGHPLESLNVYEMHQPQNSFDTNGSIKPEAIPEVIRPYMKNDNELFKVPQDDIFKIPQASPPVLPKQQQQQQQQIQAGELMRYQIKEKFPQESAAEQSRESFGGLTQGLPKKTLFGLATELDNRSEFSSKSLFGDQASASSRSQSIFSGSSSSAVDDKDPFKKPFFAISKPVTTSESSSLFSFPRGEPSKQISFGSNQGGLSSSSSGQNLFAQSMTTSSASIFPNRGSIFQKSETQPTATSAAPPPSAAFAKVDPPSIFQQESIFKSSFPGTQQQTSDLFQTKSIFSSVLEPQASQKLPQPFQQPGMPLFSGSQPPPKENLFQIPLKQNQPPPYVPQNEANRLAVEQRMKDLQELQAQKEKQLQEERKKLQVLEEQQKKKRLLLEKRKAAEKKASFLAAKHMNLWLCDLIKQIFCEELKKFRNLEYSSKIQAKRLLEEVLLEEICDIIDQEFEAMQQTYYLMQRYFKIWLDTTRRKEYQRKLLSSMPMWVVQETRSQHASKLTHSAQDLNLSMIKRYRQGQPVNFDNLLWQANEEDEIKPMNLCQLIAENFDYKHIVQHGQMHILKFIKLVFTLPSENEELPGFESLCNSWLEKYIEKPADNTDESVFYCSMDGNVALCARKITGVKAKNENGQEVTTEADHSDGLVFFMTQTNLKNSYKRLHSLLSKSRNYKALPIAFVVYDCQLNNEDELAQHLALDLLSREGQISSFEFFGCGEATNHFSFQMNLTRALRFLANEITENAINLSEEMVEMQTLSEWLDCTLGEDIWRKWEKSSIENPSFNKLCRTIEHTIGLYNHAIERLENIVNQDFETFPDFPQELKKFISPSVNATVPVDLPYFPADWKNPHRQKKLIDFLRKLKLPSLDEKYRPASNLEEFEYWIVHYTGLFIKDENASLDAAQKALQVLIIQMRKKDMISLPLEKRLHYANFLPVLKVLAFFHICNVYSRENSLKSLPEHVFYVKSSLQAYHKEAWWLDFGLIKSVKISHSKRKQNPESIKAFKPEEEYPSEAINDVIKHAEEISQKMENSLHQNIKQKKTSLEDDNDDLKRQLDEEFYHFEVAKKLGVFNLPDIDDHLDDYEEDYSHDSSDAIQMKSSFVDLHSPSKKRRRHSSSSSSKQPNNSNDFDEVIKKAMNVIKAVEKKKDAYEFLKKTAFNSDDF